MATYLFQQGITEVLNHHAPARIIQCKTSRHIKVSQKTRQLQFAAKAAYKLASRGKDAVLWRHFRQLRNQASTSLKKDQYETTHDRLENLGPQQMWKQAKNMTGQSTLGTPTQVVVDGKTIQSPIKMAEAFNNFYLEKIKKIRDKFVHPVNDPAAGIRELVSGKNLEGSFGIKPITRKQLNQSIRQMRATKSVGTDGISMKLIKDFQPILEPALHNIINRSIVTNTFPSTLKTSKIIPIQKPDTSPNNCASFRPINILPSTSKVIEKVIFSQIADHLKANKLIPDNMHGSLRNHSTTTALIEIYEEMIINYEEGKYTALISLDQSAAFDVVDHSTLVLKLKLLGMDENTLKWIKSYLGGRSQVVELQTKQSSLLEAPPCSIIQGSIASCLLFTIYTLDLPAAIHRGHMENNPAHEDSKCEAGRATIFVDDTNVVVSAPNALELQSKAQSTVDQFQLYMDSNLLCLNGDKTKFMVVAPPSVNKENITIQSGGEIIKPKTTLKCLGIYLSDSLKFEDNYSKLRSQLAHRLHTLRQLSKYASPKTLKIVARSTIIQKISYCIELWGGCKLQMRSQLQTIILQAAKIILGKQSFRMSTSSILKKVDWPSIDQLMLASTVKLATNILECEKPAVLYSHINTYTPRPSRNRDSNYRVLPSWKKTLSRRSFSYQAINGLNCLPNQIREIRQKK